MKNRRLWVILVITSFVLLCVGAILFTRLYLIQQTTLSSADIAPPPSPVVATATPLAMATPTPAPIILPTATPLAMATLEPAEASEPEPTSPAWGEAPSPTPRVSAASAEEPTPAFDVETVFYATDRKRTASSEPSEYFGGEWDESRLSYGIASVSIPRDRDQGEIPRPLAIEIPIFEIKLFELPENPENHFVLLEVTPREKTEYFSEIRQLTQASSDKSVFIFVHGFNVTFEEAAWRTAQMAYDFRALGFDGTPVFYSWPSKGRTDLLGYQADGLAVEWTKFHLKEFLIDIVEQTEAENIYIIAHSMGNRALTRAFITLITQQPELKGRFRAIILAAPDIDATIFKTEIAPQIIPQKAGDPTVTLYVSADDKAIIASKELHDGIVRVGSGGEGLVIMDGIETIDATGVGTGMFQLDHSYFGEVGLVFEDIYTLITTGNGAAKRAALQEMNSNAGRYWVFKK